MTLECGDLLVRAASGDQFQISRSVRDKVLQERQSLLIADLDQDAALRASHTLVSQAVRSLIAVPLQTRDQVIGLIYVDSSGAPSHFDEDDLDVLTFLANIAATRIEQARLLEIEGRERLLSQELDQAAEIQRSLLPKETPAFPALDIAAYSIPCRAVGGDFYDYLNLPDGRLGLLLGDVAGKGLPAALLMSGLMARAQVIAEISSDPGEIVTRLNRTVCHSCPGNRFITLFLVALDEKTGAFEYCNAGHNPPFLVRENGTVEMLEASGAVVGVFGGYAYKSTGGQLNPGDAILIYSDGVSEAVTEGKVEFTEERLLETFRGAYSLKPDEAIGVIREAVLTFAAGYPAQDDFTLAVVRRPA